MIRKIVWLLVAVLAAAVIALMIMTPTPPNGVDASPPGVTPR